MRIPVSTQEPLQTMEARAVRLDFVTNTAPNTGGTGGTGFITVPGGHLHRVVGITAFIQYDSGADSQQHVRFGMDAYTVRGLSNMITLYDCPYVAPTTEYRLSGYVGATDSSRDVITAAGLTSRNIIRSLPDIWLPEFSRYFFNYHNLGANDDARVTVFYEELRANV